MGKVKMTREAKPMIKRYRSRSRSRSRDRHRGRSERSRSRSKGRKKRKDKKRRSRDYYDSEDDSDDAGTTEIKQLEILNRKQDRTLEQSHERLNRRIKITYN